MLSPTVRAALAFALLSAWLVLLMSGVALGGTVHLLLAAALLVFPWRLLEKRGQVILSSTRGVRKNGDKRSKE